MANAVTAWGGFVNGKLDFIETNFDAGYDDGGAAIMLIRPAVFHDEREARSFYADVRRVEIKEAK